MTAPDRIWAWKSEAAGLRSQDWTADEHFGPRIGGPEYLRRDPAVLAADPMVMALIGAVVEEAAKHVISEAERLVDQKAKGAVGALAYMRELADEIRAIRPDATAALSRALQRARDEALDDAAKELRARWNDPDATGEYLAERIRALKRDKG